MSEQLLQLATFDLNGDLTETDDFVIVRGKIFHAGDFPDKQFAISPDELASVVQGFKPVPVDYSHVEGPLDGKLGELRSVSLADNGTDLMGEVAIPKWLDKALGDTARKVSCTWNRATKQLEKLALVNNPRITDAVLYGFFMADQEEKIKEDAEFVGKRNSAADHSTIQKIHDHTASLGAKCSGENVEYSSDPPNQTNSINKELPKIMTTDNTIDFKDSAEFKAQASQIEQMKAELEQMKVAARHSLAVQTVKDLIVGKKAVVAEEANLVAAFEKALQDDARYPEKVTFGQGQEGSRFDVLKAVYEARPAHALFGEQVPVGGQVLYSGTSDRKDEPNQDRIISLKKHTQLGAATIGN
jgi:hypothetical protein